MGTAAKQTFMVPDTAFESALNHSALSQKRIFTIGYCKVDITDVLRTNQIEQTIFESTDELIRTLHDIDDNLSPDVIVCCDSVEDQDVRKLVKYLHFSKLHQQIPAVLFTDNVTVKLRKEIFQLGLDDVFDTNTEEDLFFERIELIHKTKENKYNIVEDNIKLSIANIEISQSLLKRFSDIFLTVVMLILLFPLFLVVAIIIKIESRGPVFYTSKRAGAGYKIFDFYKFRSMAEGADQEMSKVLHLNQYAEGEADSNSVFYKIKGDPRVTKFGGFLRRTSIDELPQLINILKGDMSFVGNRPLPLYEAQQLTRDNWVARFNAPAGITGLWQISKRGKAEMSESERVELDVEYSKNHSFWYDISILIKTIPAIFQEDDV